MNSSGRRVTRRNLDGEESSLRDDLSEKSRFGKKPFMKNSSLSKVSRPRRAAAHNALSFLSRISGKASDGEEDVLEGNLSQSYFSDQETEAGSEETEVSSENEENGHLKCKAIVSEDLSSHQDNPKRSLMFKFLNRDTSKRELVGPSSTMPPHDIDESSLLEGSIKWGGAKSRLIKWPRITELILCVAKSLDESCPRGSYNIENVVNEKQPIKKEEFSPSDDEIQKGKMVQLNEKQEKNKDKELHIPLQNKYSGIADVKKNNIRECAILALLNYSSGSDDVFDLSPYFRESKDKETRGRVFLKQERMMQDIGSQCQLG
nr:PH-interacting protein [Tanacetum cinerariifolium]